MFFVVMEQHNVLLSASFTMSHHCIWLCCFFEELLLQPVVSFVWGMMIDSLIGYTLFIKGSKFWPFYGSCFYSFSILLRALRYTAFSLTWPAFMQIYWNKRKHLHKKRVQLPQDWLGTPTWPPFHCFGTSIWPRDITYMCSSLSWTRFQRSQSWAEYH